MKNIKIILFSSGVLCGIILLTYLFAPINTIFNVNVNTERLIVKIKDLNNSRFVFENIDIQLVGSDSYKNFSGSFEFGQNAIVTIERIAYGPAIIRVETIKSPSGKLFGESNKLLSETPKFIEFVIDSIQDMSSRGQTIILPIDGEVQLGRSIDFEISGESTAILRSGEINLNGESGLIFKETFDAGNIKLSLGDQLIVDSVNNKAFGFVTINENQGIQAAYRFKAKQARILKPGPKEINSGIIIKATPLDKFLNASSIQSISMFFGVILVLTSLVSFSMDMYNFKDKFKRIFK